MYVQCNARLVGAYSLTQQKATQSFSNSLCDSLGKLKHLDISSAQIKKMSQILQSLGRTVSLINGLTELNISQNKLDAESSKMLGTFLTLTRAVKCLGLSGT